jgi:IMP cyclohydrolase
MERCPQCGGYTAHKCIYTGKLTCYQRVCGYDEKTPQSKEVAWTKGIAVVEKAAAELRGYQDKMSAELERMTVEIMKEKIIKEPEQEENSMDYMEEASYGDEFLKEAPYPGRGIILGQTDDGEALVQIYWIMGRSESSKARAMSITRRGKGLNVDVEVIPTGNTEGLREDLLFYPAMMSIDGIYVVSNGNHTAPIFEAATRNKPLGLVVAELSHEDDYPIATPRIFGVTTKENLTCTFCMGIVKKGFTREESIRNVFEVPIPPPGIGYCIHTYEGVDDQEIESFSGEPYLVTLSDGILTHHEIWRRLNEKNRVALAARYIPFDGSSPTLHIIHSHSKTR